jgi:hypothetical protein
VARPRALFGEIVLRIDRLRAPIATELCSDAVVPDAEVTCRHSARVAASARRNASSKRSDTALIMA